MRITSALTATVVVAVAMLTGCSGDDSKTEAKPSASTPATTQAEDQGPALKAAVQSYSDAFLTGDGDAAFALLSKRCQDRLGESTFKAAVGAAGVKYGDALAFKSYEADISGTMARVTYTYAKPEINQDAEPWVNESGWKQDDC